MHPWDRGNIFDGSTTKFKSYIEKRVHKKIGACIRPVTILSLSDLTIRTLMTINNLVKFQLKHLERVCLDPWNVGKHFGTWKKVVIFKKIRNYRPEWTCKMTMKTAKSREMHLHALYMRFCILFHFSSVEHRHKMTEMNSLDDNHFRLPSTLVLFFFPIYLWFGITYLEQSPHLQQLWACFLFLFPREREPQLWYTIKTRRKKWFAMVLTILIALKPIALSCQVKRFILTSSSYRSYQRF